jgi:flavin reductase (DIM6/NTAB) family NADH-FMN oxidoreductase RutF
MKAVRKHNLPVNEIRRFLEPGPIVLVSSAYRNETNIMTMGWHMVMGFEPSLTCRRNQDFGLALLM